MNLLSTSDPTLNEYKDLPITEDIIPLLIPYATNVQYKEYSFGRVLIQEYISAPVNIYSYHFYAGPNSSIYAWFKHPTIALQFMTTGNVEALLKNLPSTLNAGHFGLFFIPPSISEGKLPEGFSHSIHFELTEAYLDDLCLAHTGTRRLVDRLHNAMQNAERLGHVPVTYDVHRLLRKLMQLKEDEKGVQLEINSIIPALLNLYRKGLLNIEKGGQASAGKISKPELLEHLYQRIKENANFHDNDIVQLTREYDIPERTLRRNFKALYGCTLRHFVNTTRMEHAHQLVVSTRIPLDQVSEILRYTDYDPFYIAFIARYNISPLKLRAEGDKLPSKKG